MKNTNSFKGLFAVFAFVFMFASVSAALTASDINVPASVAHNDGSFTIDFDLENTNGAKNVAFTLVMSDGDATLVLPSVSMADPETKELSAQINFNAHQSGNLAGKIVASGSGETEDILFNVPIDNSPSLEVTKLSSVTSSSDGLIKVENDGNIDFGSISLTDTGSVDVEFKDPSSGNVITNFALDAGESKEVKVVAVNPEDIGFGGQSFTVKATSGSTYDELVMSAEGTFCEAGDIGGRLKISNVDIENRGSGEDDEWMLLDIIEVEVEVENIWNDDVEDVIVELGFYDSDGSNQVDDLDFENADEEEIELGDVDEDEDETVVFRFKVPADFEDGNYKITVKAYSDDLGEDVECVGTAKDFDVDDVYTVIDIEREDDEGKFIAFDNFQIIPAEATCGERVSVSFDVHNIGDEDQDQVRVNLRSSFLKVDESVEIRSDLDQGDSETVTFDFTIPQGLSDKLYDLSLTADYDYDDGDYDESSDDETLFQVRVIGCSASGVNTGERIAVISANLDSDARAGEKLVVVATITNTKTEKDRFLVAADGYQSWSSVSDISSSVFELESGESKDVTFTLDVDADASGSESFEIEVRDSANNVEIREIEIDNIAGTSSPVSGFNFGDNGFLWIVGLVNVILVILIIVVAVRVARR